MRRFSLFVLVLGLICPLVGLELEWISAPENDISFYSGSSRRAHMSDDGRFVVFQSKASLTPDDQNKNWDIYVKDRKKETLSRIPFLADEYANAAPFISGNGRVVAFHSYSTAAVRGESPRLSDILLYDLAKDMQMAVPPKGFVSPLVGENLFATLDTSGRYVVFSSDASEVNGQTKNAFRSIYLFDKHRNDLSLISVSPGGVPANRQSIQALMSGNGRYIAFKSAASNLDIRFPTDAMSMHLYLFDRKKHNLHRLDTEAYHFDPFSHRIGQFDMDDRARFLVFEVFPKKGMDPQETLDISDLYEFDRKTKSIRFITKDFFEGDAHSPTLSGDGRYLAFVFRGYQKEGAGGVIVMDRKKDQIQKILDHTCDNPVLSGNGRFLAFESTNPTWRRDGDRKRKHIFMVENPLYR